MNKIKEIEMSTIHIELFLIIFIAAIITIPQLTTIGFAKLVVPCFFIWTVIILGQKNKTKYGLFVIELLFFTVYIIGNSVMRDGNFLSDRLKTYVYIIIIYVISYHYNSENNKEKLFIIFRWSMFFLFISTILNIIGILKYPQYGKMLAGSLNEEQSIMYLRLGIAGYGNIYSYALLGPSFIYLAFKNKLIVNKKSRVTLLIIGLLCTSTVYLYGYTIAIIICSILILLYLILINKKIGVLVILLLSTVPLMKNLFMLVINNINNLSVSLRLMSVYNLLFTHNGLTDESSITRVMLYKLSFNSFLKNPFIGVGGFYGNSDYIIPNGIGGHSEWLDLLGRYGIIGLILFTIPTIKTLKIINKNMQNNKSKEIFVLSMFYMLFVGALNPIALNFLVYSFMVIIPFSSFYYTKIKGGSS